MLNKSERVENVKSVMLINYVLFQYVSKFSSKYSSIHEKRQESLWRKN